jgi:hypothetical protein
MLTNFVMVGESALWLWYFNEETNKGWVVAIAKTILPIKVMGKNHHHKSLDIRNSSCMSLKSLILK